MILIFVFILSTTVSAYEIPNALSPVSAIYTDRFGNIFISTPKETATPTTVPTVASDPAEEDPANNVALTIFMAATMVAAFFVGGHIYKKYGAMLSVWKRHYLPLSLLVEPYIYSYRFQETTKPVLKKYRTKIVISFAVSFLLFSPLVGFGFTLGYVLWFFLWRSKLEFSQEMCLGAANLFKDFVMPGLEDELSEAIASFYVQKVTGIRFKY
jgi:hypothetical protein